MEFKDKKYRVIDYITLPLKVVPVSIVFIILLRIFIAAIPSMQVLATAKFIDTSIGVFRNGEVSQVLLPFIAIILLVAISWISTMILGIVRLNIDIKLNEYIRPEVVKKRSRLAYKYIENNDAWDLVSRVGEDTSERIMQGFDNLLAIMDYVVKVISLIFIIAEHVWWIAIAVFVVAVPLFYLALKSGKVDYTAFSEAQKYRRKADYLKEVISSRENVEERSLFQYSEEVDRSWFEKYEVARKIEFKATKWIFIKTKTSSIITVILSMFISLILIPSAGAGRITVGIYMGLVTASMKLVKQMSWGLSVVMKEFTKNKLYLKDLTEFSLLEEVHGADDIPDIKIQQEPFQSIEFKNVSFYYPDTDKKVLDGFSMKLEKGKQYAFVGKNGAGKTTVTKLLTGLYDNYEGEILINGRNLRELSEQQLKGYFSVVYQDFVKYYITVEDNVWLGNYGYSCDENEKSDLVKKALSSIGAMEYINKFEKGIDTELGKLFKEGSDLSGGQWQKIAIARTLISSAPIYILDEPTASLDPISESNLYKLFNEVSKGKSTIVITHRLGAARMADEILVIDDGKVVERGDHQELLAISGVYAEMFKAQRSWYNE